MLHGFAVGQLDGQGLGVAVAADEQAHLAARRNLLEHAPQLLGAFYGLPVQPQHHVVDLEADLAGGSVMVDQGDDRAAHFLELERLGLLLVHIGQVDTEVAL